jgi:hypothetical protein
MASLTIPLQVSVCCSIALLAAAGNETAFILPVNAVIKNSNILTDLTFFNIKY